MADHLKGLTLGVAVVDNLIKIMRASGYPGYSEGGINSSAQVAQRLKEHYTDIYGVASFSPAAIQKYISIVSVETPTNRATKSKRVERFTFSEQIAVIGGTLGLFTGKLC